MKRHRWGTTRNKKGKPQRENVSRSKTLKRILKPQDVIRSFSTRGSQPNSNSNSKNNSRSNSIIRGPNTNSTVINAYNYSDDDSDIGEDDEEPVDPRDRRSEKRSVALNQPLPDQFIDPQTQEPITSYPRNKIRTTKYTPLSFLPKNISNQFLRNVANIYFLVLIVLGYFEIFGVPNPELSMVPLIVIVILTAIKDAIEDSRRTASDLEVNNQTTHILEDLGTNPDFVYENKNVGDEKISLWRRFKKFNSRLMLRMIGATKRNMTKEGRAKKIRDKANRELGENHTTNRKSFDSDVLSPRNSMAANENPFRKSFQSRASMSRRTKNLKFAKSYWKTVKVGDVLRIYNNEEIPADLIILSTSEADNGCYVETKNLDGETNLKVKQSLKYGNDHKITKADDIMNRRFQISSEGPHPNLYSYQGSIKYYDESINEENEDSININNLLLRGCTLRNTKWVIGIVVFTGDDTKIMINAGVTPTKQSKISRELNYYVFINFILLFLICLASGLVNGIYYRKSETSRDFFEFGTIGGTPWKNGIISFVVAVILYQSLIPISLYITIEIIKSAQAFFIYSDANMYYERLDFPCTPKSWSISDDLGQVEYVFSDKTGTLTQNLMEFKKCTINGISYGRAYTEALAGMRKRQGFNVEEEALVERERIEKDRIEMLDGLMSIYKDNEYVDELSFVSSEFVKDLEGANGAFQKKSNEHFMLALALCHSVLIEKDEDTGKLVLKAQSPDEAALVGTARSLGFAFVGNTKQGVLIDTQGVTKEYQILNVLEFNSTRKRMSALVKVPGNTEDDEPKVLLICKGADSIIYGRLSKTHNVKTLLDKTSADLEQFATEGLRTLCIAQREFSWTQYLEWNKRHKEASASLDNREEKMEMVADSIERELILLGGTAIEDRLQDGVPDSIALLAQAGIKLWVLTGDKVETAINIGFSCNLLGNDMELLIFKNDLSDEDKAKYGIRGGSNTQVIDQLVSSYLEIFFRMSGSLEELEAATGDHSPPSEGFGVVIDGDALKIVLNDDEIKRKFLLLCKQCKAVLCCRVSPSQKAGVVKLVKNTLDVMTLAIGDGSNDVAMIQAADIGVGIAGEEGRQAVMSSDYAIGQFRFLARLLLTHGRWSYKRLGEMIPNFFYKNVIFSFALFWFGVFSDFDGTYLFEFTYLMFYNLAFTSLPVIFMGVFDQDVSAKVSMLVPELYRSGILRLDFNQSKVWSYMIDGLYQSVISFMFPYLVYYKGFVDMAGLASNHRFWMGIIVTCIACVSCNFYILLHQYRWDWLSLLIVFLSIASVYFWTGVWTSALSSGEFYLAAAQMFGSLTFWACSVVGIMVSILPRFTYDFTQRIFWPKDVDIVRECWLRGDFDAYPEDYDPTDPNKVKVSEYSSEKIKNLGNSGSTSTTPNGSSLDSKNQSDLERQYHMNSSSTIQVDQVPIQSGQSMPLPQRQERKSIIDMFKRKSNVRSTYYDNSSFIDSYKEPQDSLKTEEIALDEFDKNIRRASRISSDNKRYSIDRRYPSEGRSNVRTSLEFPELTTSESLTQER
ncbi:phospholipid-translocating P-type ATPase [Yamadazyma tenuis ATCC 10573]|uniref:Phospholipid-transporting ATPase n=2 Tax=Candida tenuis TaxID=2315449 RepID=G3B911_CANTC|nr:phospholipid-translocating P-type ATPase [Yamadazyma tenuis ATCC 10573]EGV62433.1 phospholipid-translocating P-type ATPase [Yamadazyma tenuis ATCC 10573]